MGIHVFYSAAKDAAAAVNDIQSQARAVQPKGVVFFASSNLHPHAVSAGMQAAFSSACCLGCTTAGELISGKMLTGSLVAMLLEDDVVEDMDVQLVHDLKSADRVPAALEALSRHFAVPVSSMDLEKHVGIVLIDGLSGKEESVMDTLGNLTDLSFIGGSAGDDLKFAQTYVFAKGEASSNAAVIGLLKLRNGFEILKTQSFCSTGKTLTATAVNEAERRVMAFNGKPAKDAYAAALGCDKQQADGKFMSNPLGLMVADEPYIRSPQRFDCDDMIFYCNIKEGMQLHVMESADLVGDTRQALAEKMDSVGPIKGLIDFHCILRTLELRQKSLCDAYGKIFTSVPMIGFSTYGEEYIGHINQTSTILLFK